MNHEKQHKILYIDDWTPVDPLTISGNGLGASIFKLAAFSDAATAGYQVELLTTKVKKQLLSQARGIFKIHTKADTILWDSYEKIISMGIFIDQLNKEFYPFTKKDRLEYKSTAHIDFWRRFSARALDMSTPSNPAQVELHIKERELEEARELLSAPGQWITVSTQVISPLKDYAGWSEFINLLLAENFNVLLLGNESMPYKEHPQILNMCGKTDIELLKALIATADAFVGNDGLNANLALFLKTPAVVLFSMISPESVIDPHQELRSPVSSLVSGGCPQQFCYSKISNYRNAGCPWNIEKGTLLAPLQCLQFEATDIFEELKKLLL
jgi:hypothetical protein